MQHRAFFPVLLFVIVVGFYWKLTLTTQFDWISTPDLALQVLPWFQEEMRQVHNGEIPLWDPHNWLGMPMLGQGQPGTAYPLNWLLFLIPPVHGHIRVGALQWYFVIIHYMAALFCYLLCRDLGRSRLASLVAGLVFALAGYVGTTDWPQMVNGAVWAPLVLMFLLRAIRGFHPLGSAALAGLSLGVSWLSGHHQVPLFLTLMVTGVWLYYILREGRINWRLVQLAVVMAAIMALVGALQILPINEYGHLAKRWVGPPNPVGWDQVVPYWVHRNYALGVLSLFAIIFPGWNRNADPFIGVVAFSLVLLALALCWNQRWVKLFSAIAIGGILFALGPNSVFQGFLYGLVPMVDKARVPSMAVIVFNIGAAVLVAFGVDYFAACGTGIPACDVWAGRIVRGILAFGLLIFTLLLGGMFAHQLHWDADDRVALSALIAILLAALLYAWRTGNLTGQQAGTLLVMLLLLELGNDSGYPFAHRDEDDRQKDLRSIRNNGDIADYLHAQPGVFRIESRTDAVAKNWAEYHNFDTVEAMGASVTTNVLNTEWHTWQSRLLFGVLFTIAEKPPLDDSKEVYTAASGLKLYMNPGAWPRAWAVHEIVPIRDLGQGRALINDHLGDLRSKAFSLEKIPALSPCFAPDDVRISRYAAESVAIQANLGCGGMVVLSDTWFPGWEAKVDGRPERIYEVDNCMRGVIVAQGKHELTMAYRPRSVYLGAILAALGVAASIFLAFFGRKHEDSH